jgi:protein-tyrosine phosphatase
VSDRAGHAKGASHEPVQILFVCLGNICRSPTAEAVMRELVVKRGLERFVQLDSAGTGSWHSGQSPDPRAIAAGRLRDLRLSGSARQVEVADFERFDLILAMDKSNASDLLRLAPDAEGAGKVKLLREYDEEARRTGDVEVPDPYYGGDEGFQRVIDLVQTACVGVLDSLRLLDSPSTSHSSSTVDASISRSPSTLDLPDPSGQTRS